MQDAHLGIIVAQSKQTIETMMALGQVVVERRNPTNARVVPCSTPTIAGGEVLVKVAKQVPRALDVVLLPPSLCATSGSISLRTTLALPLCLMQ